MTKKTNKNLILSTIFTFASTLTFASPPPPVPPPPPGLPLDSNLIILISISLIYVVYKLQSLNKKASI
jgi:hypothetical protein